jgi:hypothetical protein
MWGLSIVSRGGPMTGALTIFYPDRGSSFLQVLGGLHGRNESGGT